MMGQPCSLQRYRHSLALEGQLTEVGAECSTYENHSLVQFLLKGSLIGAASVMGP